MAEINNQPSSRAAASLVWVAHASRPAPAGATMFRRRQFFFRFKFARTRSQIQCPTFDLSFSLVRREYLQNQIEAHE